MSAEDIARRQALVLANMPLAMFMARRRWLSTHKINELDDIKQAAFHGLCIAAKGFDPQRGVPFAAYAQRGINAYISRHITACCRSSATNRTTMDRRGKFWQDHDQVNRWWHDLDTGKVENLVTAARKAIGWRDRVLIRLHYDEGMSLAGIARILGVSKQCVSWWHRAALACMRRRLGA